MKKSGNHHNQKRRIVNRNRSSGDSDVQRFYIYVMLLLC